MRENIEYNVPQKESEEGITRRELFKGAGLFGLLLAAKPKEAAALVEEWANKERKEGEPKISIEIFYGAHGTKKDVEWLKEKLKTADIYAPELAGFRKNDNRIFNEVSQGKKEPAKALEELRAEKNHPFYPYFLHQLHAIYESRKWIILLDAPKGKLTEKFDELETHGIRPLESIEATIKYVKEYLQAETKLQEIREKFILGNLENLIDLIRKDRRFKKPRGKKEIHILMSMGAFHTKMYQYLQESGKEVKRAFDIMPFIYDFHSEGSRRYAFGKPVEDELAMKILLEQNIPLIYETQLDSLTQNSLKKIQFKRKIVDQFNINEVKKMFELVNEKFDRGKGFWERVVLTHKDAEMVEDAKRILDEMRKNPYETRRFLFTDVLFDKIREKNIKFPQTEKELGEMIGWKEKQE